MFCSNCRLIMNTENILVSYPHWMHQSWPYARDWMQKQTNKNQHHAFFAHVAKKVLFIYWTNFNRLSKSKIILSDTRWSRAINDEIYVNGKIACVTRNGWQLTNNGDGAHHTKLLHTTEDEHWAADITVESEQKSGGQEAVLNFILHAVYTYRCSARTENIDRAALSPTESYAVRWVVGDSMQIASAKSYSTAL